MCAHPAGLCWKWVWKKFDGPWWIKKEPEPIFFSSFWRPFRPPFRPQKKKNSFMLKQGLNCNFNFYIVKNWSASWWPNLVTNIIFDLMGLLWDVCWPHWPNLAKIRLPPSVRSVSLTTGLAVNVIWWKCRRKKTKKEKLIQELWWK